MLITPEMILPGLHSNLKQWLLKYDIKGYITWIEVSKMPGCHALLFQKKTRKKML